MRREFPLMLVFLAGVVMAVQFFVPSEFSGNVKDFMNDWLIIIGIFAMALGIYSLVRVSFARITRRLPNWQYSIITLVGLFAMMFFGVQFPGVKYGPTIPSNDAVDVAKRQVAFMHTTLDSAATLIPAHQFIPQLKIAADSLALITNYIQDEEWITKSEQQVTGLQTLAASGAQLLQSANSLPIVLGDTAAFAAATGQLSSQIDSVGVGITGLGALHNVDPFIGGQASYMFRQFFNYIMIPIQATMFSLLAFFIASAAYRAFRARSLLATVLLLAALVLMGRLVPMGPVTTFLNDLSSWILLTPNLAAKRAILIGVGLGMVATAFKVVLGIERNYLGRD